MASLDKALSFSTNVAVNLTAIVNPLTSSGYGPPFMTACYAIIGVVGMLSNATVVFVVVFLSPSRQSVNVFITNQSLIDLWTSIMLILCYVIPPVQFPDARLTGSWGTFVCLFWYSKYPCWGGIVSSTANLACLTLERYLAVRYPLRYQRFFWWPRSLYFAVVPWAFGYTYQLHWVLFHNFDESTGLCTNQPSKTLQIVTGVMVFVSQYIAPLVFMTFVYSRIALSLQVGVGGGASSTTSEAASSSYGGRSSGRPTATESQTSRGTTFRLKARRNVIRTLVLVCVAFFICWTPNQIGHLVFNVADDIDRSTALFRFTIILAYSNMIVNPFVYAFNYRRFRVALVKAVPCLRVIIRWN